MTRSMKLTALAALTHCCAGASLASARTSFADTEPKKGAGICNIQVDGADTGGGGSAKTIGEGEGTGTAATFGGTSDKAAIIDGEGTGTAQMQQAQEGGIGLQRQHQGEIPAFGAAASTTGQVQQQGGRTVKEGVHDWTTERRPEMDSLPTHTKIQLGK